MKFSILIILIILVGIYLLRHKLIYLLRELSTLFVQNKGMCIGFLISFIIVASYKFTENMQAINPYGEFLYSLSKDIGLSYMGGFIFYIMQVYLPEKKERFKIKKGIKSKIIDIIICLEYPNKQAYYLLKGSYIQDKQINTDLVKCISKNIDLFSNGTRMNDNYENIPFLEELNINNIKLRNKINSIYKLYGTYIDSELIKILDEIEEFLEFNFFTSLTEITISNVSDGNFASKKDMYVNPKKYIENNITCIHRRQKSNTFIQYYNLQCKLYQYYINI